MHTVARRVTLPRNLSSHAARTVTRSPLSHVLAFGPVVWDAVGGDVGARSPFMSWAWHRAWADSATPAELAASEVLLLHAPDGVLQALIPITVRRLRFRRVWVRALTWAIGDVGCPDELDVAAHADADLAALVSTFEDMPWDVVILSNLAAAAPNARRLSAALEARGHVARHRPLWSCPQLDLPDSWDAYLATLSANRRQILRRKERSLRGNHAVALTDYAADGLDEGWGHLMRLHERRWGDDGGAFRDPRSERMQRQFAGEMARRQQLWLTTLDVDGQPAAAWYGFACGRTVYFYQGGRDPRWERESVGLVLMGMMIQRAIQQGYRAFNFLRGDDPYKRQWTPSGRMTEETVIFRSGWAGLGLRALDAVAGLRGGAHRDG
jgi:CelD/BcsL family acetyltransferase involved in cellulose biosynthesis